MPNKQPHFDNASIAHLAMELYGIEGEISSFVSYEDQNAYMLISQKPARALLKKLEEGDFRVDIKTHS